jgi:ketosteroid isomerase-like protein
MKRIVSSAAMLALSCAAFAQTPATGASERSPEAAAVHSAVEEIVAAIARNDADGFDRLSTPDYTFVNPAGLVWTKAQYLGRIRSGDLKVESYTRDEENIRVYGNTAVVIYRSTPRGTFNGQELSNQRRVTSIFVKDGGRWLTAGRQSTPIVTAK